jgi:hypothetical protein
LRFAKAQKRQQPKKAPRIGFVAMTSAAAGGQKPRSIFAKAFAI